MLQNFSYINQVPQCNDLIDIALSKTNRKTPTVIRAKYEIHRIRSFYVRKVKFSSDEFITRLESIVQEFPVLEDMHPFYSDLINVLYDRDHYKIALGQVNGAKHKIEAIAKEHTRLLNFGDTLYRCKELKKAALGKMASSIKKLAEPLKYLEEVRQHMTRLPAIDPAARTIIICGFPNVGKSTFINSITEAHVDVQDYAFTTKSIFVGHFEYESLRWQVLDTPGILDKALTERSSVEMLTITALAHLKAAVLFFMDPSETCGHTVNEQIDLYKNLVPLLNSEVLIVLSKSDVVSAMQPVLSEFLSDKIHVTMSAKANINVDLVKSTVCDMLLKSRITEKNDRIGGFAHRIRPFIPREVNEKYDGDHLGTNPYLGMPVGDAYFCEEKDDIIPEIYNGKNVADFIDPNITEKLEQVKNQIQGECLRKFDILDRESRQLLVDCNNARISANMKAHFARRATMPASWKNTVNSNGEIVADMPPVALKKIEHVHHNKKVKADVKKTYADLRPKYTFRPKGNKLARK